VPETGGECLFDGARGQARVLDGFEEADAKYTQIRSALARVAADARSSVLPLPGFAVTPNLV
jgi:hypothetical protein